MRQVEDLQVNQFDYFLGYHLDLIVLQRELPQTTDSFQILPLDLLRNETSQNTR